jgi:predicted RNase H-like HicB family nuclease/DNA-binding XRE family transcriptional regulator
LKYLAIITKEVKYTLAEFPDLPGCQTFVGPGENLRAKASDALEGWLAVGLQDGEAPPRPSLAQSRRGIELIPVPPQVAVALAIRWVRQDQKLTQHELAALVGVSQQRIAKLERVQSNLTLRTLDTVAKALRHELHIELTPVT